MFSALGVYTNSCISSHITGIDGYSNAMYVGGDESSLCLLKGGADDAHSCGSLFVP